MCLGGGGGDDYPEPRYLSRTDPPPGPASPPDMVDGQPLTNQAYYENIAKLKVNKKQGAQSSKSYGGAA